MSNIEIVQLLANGYTVSRIAKENNIPATTLQKKIYVLRERCLCKTVAQLCVVYLKKELITYEF